MKITRKNVGGDDVAIRLDDKVERPAATVRDPPPKNCILDGARYWILLSKVLAWQIE